MISSLDYAVLNGKLRNNLFSVLDYFISKHGIFNPKPQKIR